MTESEWGVTVVKAFMILAALASACCGPQRVGGDDLPVPAVVRLYELNDGSKDFNCSVFRIEGDLLGTAGHCCADDTAYTIGEVGDEATVLVDDDENDVCIMRGRLPGANVGLALHDPAVGALVYNYGFPRGNPVISAGYWSGRNEDGLGICSIVVKGGSSGSPVFDRDGRLVGLVSRAYRDGDSIAFMATIEHIRAALVRARKL